MKKKFALLQKSTLLFLLTFLPVAHAQQLASPTGDVLLRITGNITTTNNGDSAEFDLAMLEAMTQTEFTTSTPWTDNPTLFTGVEVTRLLKAVGAGSTQIRAKALDKYWFDADTKNFANVPAIVAYKKDGNYMRIRDQGPLWIMLPFDDYPEALTETNKNICVWQLLEIVIL